MVPWSGGQILSEKPPPPPCMSCCMPQAWAAMGSTVCRGTPVPGSTAHAQQQLAACGPAQCGAGQKNAQRTTVSGQAWTALIALSRHVCACCLGGGLHEHVSELPIERKEGQREKGARTRTHTCKSTRTHKYTHKYTQKHMQTRTQINTKETQTTRKKGKVSTAVIDDCAFVVVVVIVRKQASAKTQKNWLRTVSKKKKKKSSA